MRCRYDDDDDDNDDDDEEEEVFPGPRVLEVSWRRGRSPAVPTNQSRSILTRTPGGTFPQV